MPLAWYSSGGAYFVCTPLVHRYWSCFFMPLIQQRWRWLCDATVTCSCVCLLWLHTAVVLGVLLCHWCMLLFYATGTVVGLALAFNATISDSEISICCFIYHREYYRAEARYAFCFLKHVWTGTCSGALALLELRCQLERSLFCLCCHCTADALASYAMSWCHENLLLLFVDMSLVKRQLFAPV